MSFRVRPARNEDFQAIYEMAKLTGGGFTNLPPDKGALVAKLARSDDAFSREEGDPNGDLFVFVLENSETGAIRGTCQVFSRVGMVEPFYSYRISTLTQTSPELGKTFRAEMLTLCTDFEGCSEVGGLFLHPNERAGGLGVLLARSRYLFIRLHRARFAGEGAGGAARRDRRGRRLAFLGRHRRPLLRHELPGGGRLQRRPRHPLHRRSDAKDADLHGDAAGKRSRDHVGAASLGPRRDADAGAGRVQRRRLYRHFRRRPDHVGEDRRDPHHPRGARAHRRRNRGRAGQAP